MPEDPKAVRGPVAPAGPVAVPATTTAVQFVRVAPDQVVPNEFKGHLVLRSGDKNTNLYLQNFDEASGLGDVTVDHPVIQQIVNTAVSRQQGSLPGKPVYAYVYAIEGTKDFAVHVSHEQATVVAPAK